MYEKLEEASENSESIVKLFRKFDNPVSTFENTNFSKLKINEIINEAIENAIDRVVSHIFNSRKILTSSNDVNKVAEVCEQFFQKSNFGTFEYMQRTGRSNFKVNHSSGVNGTKFLRKFFERIFKTCLKNYSFHIISDNTYVCVIFR